MARIVLLCATRRGLDCLKALVRLKPRGTSVAVVSSKEAPGEPRYYDDIRKFCAQKKIPFADRSQKLPKGDLALCVHWRHMAPKETLESFPLGFVVLHDSLLPKRRGFSPTVWALAEGDTRLGATMLFANAKPDQGDVIDQIAIPVGPQETIADVFGRVTQCYVQLLKRNVPKLLKGTARAKRQDASQATVCRRRTEDDLRLDLSKSPQEIWNLIRSAVHPYPGAWLKGPGGRKIRLTGGRLD